MLMTPWVQRLLAANVLVFLLGSFLPLNAHFAFVPWAILQRPWTLVTYLFLHGGIMHLASNMIGLFFFGPRLEERLGGTRFIRFYFACGVCGAVLSLILFAFAPFGAMIGASGAVFGVVVGFARYWPDDSVYIMGVLPIRARALAIFLVAWSIFAGVIGEGGNVAHFAHLGGAVAGWLYLRTWERRRRSQVAQQPTSKGKPPGLRKSPSTRDVDAVERWKAVPRERLHEINREELEALLKKIDQSGVKALTPNERAFLDRIADLP